MFLTLISITALFALFALVAIMALRHGVDSRTHAPGGSLVSSDYTTPVHGWWR